MKRFEYGLAAILLFVLNGSAQELKTGNEFDFKCGSITTHFDKETVEYNFRSLDDLTAGIDEIIHEFNSQSGKKEENNDGLIKIEIKLEFSVGSAAVIISESVTSNCTDEALTRTTIRLKTILMTAAG